MCYPISSGWVKRQFRRTHVIIGQRLFASFRDDAGGISISLSSFVKEKSGLSLWGRRFRSLTIPGAIISNYIIFCSCNLPQSEWMNRGRLWSSRENFIIFEDKTRLWLRECHMKIMAWSAHYLNCLPKWTWCIDISFGMKSFKRRMRSLVSRAFQRK